MHELQLCENSADNDQGRPAWPVRGCHIMKQSMLTFLWWCLNITIKCLCFFPGILQTLPWPAVGAGWGWKGHSCPTLGLLHPLTHTLTFSTKQQGDAPSSPLRLSNPELTQAWVQGPESCPVTTPTNTIFGTCWNLSYAGCNRLLGSLMMIINSCTVVVFFHFSYVS